MNVEKVIPLAKGIIKKLIVYRKYDQSTGGTNDSRYCYSVWLRHLILAHKNEIKNINGTVAELGPGDSLGIGLAALLTGSEKYYAMDVHKYWDIARNLQIFDDLVVLLRNRTRVPGDEEFPRVIPMLDDYSFPFHILTDKILEDSLTEQRVAKIRNEIVNLHNQENNTMVRYFIPWNDHAVIENNSVDFIYSQAVLQYVDDLDTTYSTLSKWLKPGGSMSHSIDFSSHGITNSWNGHWLFSDTEWKLVHGNNKIILNRAPRSEHLKLIKNNYFSVVDTKDYRKPSVLSNNHFAKAFRNLLPEDISIHAMVVQAKKTMIIFTFFLQKMSFCAYKYLNTVEELAETI